MTKQRLALPAGGALAFVLALSGCAKNPFAVHEDDYGRRVPVERTRSIANNTFESEEQETFEEAVESATGEYVNPFDGLDEFAAEPQSA